MGISGPFWDSLKSCKSAVSRGELEGKWLAIDLSAWIVEADKSSGLKQAHSNPHLFLVFSRVLELLRHKCRVIAVLEGPAHPSKKRKRRKLLDEKGESARTLLEALGVRVVQAVGEGEATAAALNVLGFADGVVTEDGDALLYGARLVYRGLTCDALRNESVSKYDVTQHEVFSLGDTHKSLVAFALLVGTDIHSNAAPRIGVDKALTFVKHCGRMVNIDALDVLESWREDRPDLKEFRTNFLAGASRDTSGIITAIWKHFGTTKTAFPDPQLVLQYCDTASKLPNDLWDRSQRISRQPSAKALFYVNALAPVIGSDVTSSWSAMKSILSRDRKIDADEIIDGHSCTTADPILKEAPAFEIYYDPDFTFSPSEPDQVHTNSSP